jgi:hypothetical protein
VSSGLPVTAVLRAAFKQRACHAIIFLEQPQQPN